jgi:hypothetical protein
MPAERLLAWLIEDLTWGGMLFAFFLFVATFAGSLLVVGLLLVALPATYFQDDHPRDFWPNRHPALRLTGRIAKNLVGFVLLVVGIILALPGVPGQGILTILIGIMLLDFPGKRRFERAIVGRPHILATINRLRQRFRKPSLVLDHPPHRA